MTPASVTALLIGIVSVNIIWGYPWVGMFAACASLMLVGWTINRVMRPKLQIGFSLPTSTPADQPFSIQTHARNCGLLPAMDVSLAFSKKRPARSRAGSRRSNHSNQHSGRAAERRKGATSFESLMPSQFVSMIHPTEQTVYESLGVFHRRGIHLLPDVLVTSTFPFHLFRAIRQYPSDAKIAVTPRLLTGKEDASAKGLLNTLGGFSHRLLSGDALDYTGSREYQTGMPVRRWDFASWARLGRPIVREFQSPSVKIVLLVVDTSSADGESDQHDAETLERLLSLAATAVTELNRKMVRVRLYVVSESPSEVEVVGALQSQSDTESLLIRLAGAEAVSVETANKNIDEVLQDVGRSPVLMLTSRPDQDLPQIKSPNSTVIRVDRSHGTRIQASGSTESTTETNSAA